MKDTLVKVLGIAWKKGTGVWGSPDVIASCSDDKTVRVWEQNLSGSFVCKAVLEVSSMVRSCAWSPECKLLAAACSNATTVIWKDDGVHAYECIYTLKGHENEVRSVSWNERGQLLATCGGDKSVWVWEVLPGDEFDCATVLQGHTDDVNTVEWYYDDLFSASCDNTIKAWRERRDNDGVWNCIINLGESDSGHTSTVRSLSVSKYREYMVSCSDDLTIKIWICETDKLYLTDFIGHWVCACTLSGYHDTTIFSVDWLRDLRSRVVLDERDPNIIASSGADDAIRVFIENKDKEVDGLTFKLLLKKEKAHETNINSVNWHSGDKRLLASASDDGTLKIWEFICPWPLAAY